MSVKIAGCPAPGSRKVSFRYEKQGESKKVQRRGAGIPGTRDTDGTQQRRGMRGGAAYGLFHETVTDEQAHRLDTSGSAPV